MIRLGLSPREGDGIPGVAVKCVDIRRNTGGEGGHLARNVPIVQNIHLGEYILRNESHLMGFLEEFNNTLLGIVMLHNKEWQQRHR